MTEIGLLMTGVLTTRQSSAPNLPEQQLLQMENDNTDQLRQSKLSLTADVTPPEFIQADGSSQMGLSTSTLENENSLKKIKKSNQSLNDSGLAESQKYAQSLDKDGKYQDKAVGRFQKFSSQPLPTLYFGSSGVAVRALQRLLVSNGYNIRIDGVFGAFTETAVKSFQNKHNLTADGIVGQRTWRALTI